MKTAEQSSREATRAFRDQSREERAQRLAGLNVEDLPDSAVQQWPEQDEPMFPPKRRGEIYI